MYRSRSDSGAGNVPNYLTQTFPVCPGAQYKVGFKVRRTTTAGIVSATADINGSALAGGTVTNGQNTFAQAGNIGAATWTAPSGAKSATLTITFLYSGSANSQKEMQIDDVSVMRV